MDGISPFCFEQLPPGTGGLRQGHLVVLLWFPGLSKTKCEIMFCPQSVDREATVAVFFKKKALDSLGSL